MVNRDHQHWALIGLLLVVGLALALAYQRPISVQLNLGLEEGYDNDLPFLGYFHRPEQRSDIPGNYRWTYPEAWIEAPQVPDGSYLLSLQQINGAPAMLEVQGHQFSATATDRTVHVLVPATDSTLRVPIRATALFPSADERQLGVALQGGSLVRLSGLAIPPWRPIAAWLGAVLALWLVVSWLGGSISEASLLSGLLGAGAVAATLAAPLRVGLATPAIFQTTLLGLLGALVMRWLAPRILRWFDVELAATWLRWLVLASTAVWALKLGGRLVPGSMPGDILFHRNVLWELMRGNPYRTAVHRGIPFPYPSALYVLLAPFTATGLSEIWLLQVAAAACEALGVAGLFGLVQRMTRRPLAALLAALLYGLFPAGFMTIAWSFDAHIFAQLLALAWCGLLVRWWPRLDQRRIWLGITGGLVLIALSHFGFYINISLLAGLLAGWSWLAWPATRRQSVALALSLLAMQVIVWGVFYTAFLEQLQCVASFTAQQAACPVQSYTPATARLAILRDIFTSGFWRHYGLIPVLLAPLGLLLLRREAGEQRRLAVVVGATLLVSLGLGSLPLLTGAPITTRWLMFSAWAIAICTGITLDRVWHYGWVGRLATVGSMLALSGWGLLLWIETVIYRIRPPEPF